MQIGAIDRVYNTADPCSKQSLLHSIFRQITKGRQQFLVIFFLYVSVCVFYCMNLKGQCHEIFDFWFFS
jgi:hypothetical protein